MFVILVIVTKNANRVGKREFFAAVSRRAHVPSTMVERVYDAMVVEITETLAQNKEIVLRGFGRWYPRWFSGHVVSTGRHLDGGTRVVDDYAVMKFSAIPDLNKKLTSMSKSRQE